MSLAIPYMVKDRSAGRIQFVSVSHHYITWVVLVSLLFSLLVCSGVIIEIAMPSAHHDDVAFLHVDEHAKQSGNTRHEHVCCNALNNLLAYSPQDSKIQAMLYNLLSVLLPVAILYPVFLLPILSLIYDTAPSDAEPRHVLIANSIWPHAPPR